ncbi:hypothetical protein FBALC1_01072 [Flavobacteriales bacterium ALC-1]|nr:hypothetical protein FBALC1_01072 [Flavobacteriales bacterium ALC-1]
MFMFTMRFWKNCVHYSFRAGSKYFNKIEYRFVFNFHLVIVLVLQCKDGVEAGIKE